MTVEEARAEANLVSHLLTQSESACADALRLVRYGPTLTPAVCPRCDTSRFCRLRDRPRVDQCLGCKHQLSVTAGTALHGLKQPLCHVFIAAVLLTREGSISTNRLAGLLMIPWRSAWHLGHRVRAALSEDAPQIAEPRELRDAQVPVRRDPGEKPKDRWAARWLTPSVRLAALIGQDGSCIVDVTLRDADYALKHLVEVHLPDQQDVPWRPGGHPVLLSMTRVLGSTHHDVSRRWLRLYVRALAWCSGARNQPGIAGQALRAVMTAKPRTWTELRPPRVPNRAPLFGTQEG